MDKVYYYVESWELAIDNDCNELYICHLYKGGYYFYTFNLITNKLIKRPLNDSYDSYFNSVGGASLFIDNKFHIIGYEAKDNHLIIKKKLKYKENKSNYILTKYKGWNSH